MEFWFAVAYFEGWKMAFGFVRVIGLKGEGEMRKEKKMGMKPSMSRLTALLWPSYRYRPTKSWKIWVITSWVKCAKWVSIRNWSILSNEWWMTKIEWGVMSDEKKKKPNSLLSTCFIHTIENRLFSLSSLPKILQKLVSLSQEELIFSCTNSTLSWRWWIIGKNQSHA